MLDQEKDSKGGSQAVPDISKFKLFNTYNMFRKLASTSLTPLSLLTKLSQGKIEQTSESALVIFN